MVAQDPHPGSLHPQGAGLSVRDRGGRLHVLPRHRPDLPAHRSGHHQERPVHPRDAAPALHAPAFLALTLPMATLVAVLLVCGRLAGDLEVAALKASGVSPLRLFRPFLAVGIIITLLISWLTLVVGPSRWSSRKPPCPTSTPRRT